MDSLALASNYDKVVNAKAGSIRKGGGVGSRGRQNSSRVEATLATHRHTNMTFYDIIMNYALASIDTQLLPVVKLENYILDPWMTDYEVIGIHVGQSRHVSIKFNMYNITHHVGRIPIGINFTHITSFQ